MNVLLKSTVLTDLFTVIKALNHYVIYMRNVPWGISVMCVLKNVLIFVNFLVLKKNFIVPRPE